jgi:hypothetical protein
MFPTFKDQLAMESIFEAVWPTSVSPAKADLDFLTSVTFR